LLAGMKHRHNRTCIRVRHRISVSGMATKRMEAAESGAVKYEAAPCRKCGCTERYVSNGACTECHRARTLENADRLRKAIEKGREAKR
jgi:hypothetical protein